MTRGPLRHRKGLILETTSQTAPKVGGRTPKCYTRCKTQWDDAEEPDFVDLAATYSANDRTAVIYRGDDYICDLNLSTGQQSTIGDRVEGIPALLLVISVPLCFVLIGIPLYFGVKLYAKVSTGQLRRRVADYIERALPPTPIAGAPAS
ncbi:MAG: hypothetical protein R3C52_11310 [Hyphomonadaceae bacterium]